MQIPTDRYLEESFKDKPDFKNLTQKQKIKLLERNGQVDLYETILSDQRKAT